MTRANAYTSPYYTPAEMPDASTSEQTADAKYGWMKMSDSMTSMYRNPKPKRSGNQGEQVAQENYKIDVDPKSFIDDREQMIEVKTCRRWQVDNNANGGRRRGRFILDVDQHRILEIHDGRYLFIVLYEGEEARLYDLSIVPARSIKYRRKIPWPEVIRQ